MQSSPVFLFVQRRCQSFVLAPKTGEPVADKHLTQVPCFTGVQHQDNSGLLTSRSEDGFRTRQGRLPEKVRLRGINTLAAGNEFLP